MAVFYVVRTSPPEDTGAFKVFEGNHLPAKVHAELAIADGAEVAVIYEIYIVDSLEAAVDGYGRKFIVNSFIIIALVFFSLPASSAEFYGFAPTTIRSVPGITPVLSLVPTGSCKALFRPKTNASRDALSSSDGMVELTTVIPAQDEADS